MEQVDNLLDPSSWLGWRGRFPVHQEALINEPSLPVQKIQDVTYACFLGLSELLESSLTCSRRCSNMLWIALYTSVVWIRLGEEL